MKNWKRILALALGMTLTFGPAAYAEVTVPPLTIANESQATQAATAPTASGTGTADGPTSAPTTGENTTAGNTTAGNTASAPTTGGNVVSGPTTAPTADGNTTTTPTTNGNTASAPTTGNGPSTPTGNTGNTGNTDTQAAISEPIVVADGAVLMDAATGKVLYGKNQDKQFCPASITKVMTALVVLEHCNLSDTVTFSSTATTNLESGAVSLGISEGDQLTVEQALYGLLLKSANEIGNGLAEHVGGSISGFAEMMNAKAKALGCKNTHFANPHGLNDSTHKTTPYDMALILSAALQNAAFRKIDTTTSYEFPAIKKAAARTITMGHKMMYPTDSRYYEGIIGGKTGYTSLAGNTLVTGVERNGVRLVAVVMKAKGTQYTDTKAMLDYGFANDKVLTGNTGSTAADTAASGWKQDAQGWYYLKANGSRAAGEWQTVNGKEYWFDANAYMATGWRHFANGDWYYFSMEDGHMMSGTWVTDSGDWYYLGSSGVLLTNTTTPDGYPVDENGILIRQ